jgi:hypothetical protein
LPQACNQPATVDLPKRCNQRLSCRDACRLQHDSVYRHLFAILMLRTDLGDGERLDDAVSLRIEADGRVLPDGGRIERAGGDEELKERLLLRRRTAAE